VRRRISADRSKVEIIRDHFADYARATLELEDVLNIVEPQESDQFVIHTPYGSYRVTVEEE
jgi:hypothetical protein